MYARQFSHRRGPLSPARGHHTEPRPGRVILDCWCVRVRGSNQKRRFATSRAPFLVQEKGRGAPVAHRWTITPTTSPDSVDVSALHETSFFIALSQARTSQRRRHTHASGRDPEHNTALDAEHVEQHLTEVHKRHRLFIRPHARHGLHHHRHRELLGPTGPKRPQRRNDEVNICKKSCTQKNEGICDDSTSP